jgi:hypothetical protein
LLGKEAKRGGTTLGIISIVDQSPKARTKYEAEQAEIKLKRDMFDGKYGKQFGTMSFAKFVGDPHAANDQFGEDTFLDWAKNTSARGNMIAFGCVRCFELSPARPWARSRQVQSRNSKAQDCTP